MGWVVPLVMLSLGLLTGCQGTPRPETQVTDVRVVDQTEAGARVVVTLQLTNPTNEEWPLKQADYRVVVDGFEPFALTGYVPDAVITPEGSIEIALGAGLETAGENLIGRSYRVSGVVLYRPPGELRDIAFDSGVPLPAVVFSDEGVLE